MRMSSLASKAFVAIAATLLGGVALASAATTAYAGDDSFECPGTRCTGRQTPTCCTVTYKQGNDMASDLYYFPNAT